MPSNLPISRLIRVQVVLSALAAQAQNLSTLLCLTSSAVVDVVERIRTYNTLTDVANDFGTTGPEYAAAVLWYQQTPQPTQIKIGRWAKTATKAHVKGSLLSAAAQAIAGFNAVTTPAFSMLIDGVPVTISPVSFATSVNLNGVAALVQTALAAAVAGSTCVWNSIYSRFELTGGTTGASASFSFPTAPTAYGSINFAANPAANATITLGGTVVTFVAAGPVGNQVLIGANTAATLANLLTFLSTSADANLVKFKYSVLGNYLYLQAAATGVAGNALTIAASVATASGATLSGGSGTDVSAMLGLTVASSGAYVVGGMAAETALAAATLHDQRFGQTWYGLTIPEATDDDQVAVAGFIEATNNKHVFGVSTQDAAVLSAIATSDVAYRLNALGYKKTVVQYSSQSAYSACSLLGRALTVNYNGNNTVITLMYKQEPGIVAENLVESQMQALAAKCCNVFVAYNNSTAIIEQGKVSSGDFIDTITGADAFAIGVMNNLYNLLYTSPTKIPQTDAGANVSVTTVAAVCNQFVENGFLAPGVWDQAGFGNLAQGDFLPKGYYIYAQPVASQFKADRQARKSVPIQVAAKCAGAVHSFDVQLNISR
jgi:hypothetical protein